MEFYCDQFWFCNVMPPEWHWVMPLGMPLLLIIIVAVPVANILHRAGRSRWWTILAFVPPVNLIGLWGVRVHPMAQPRLGRWPAGVTNVCPAGSRGPVSR
jgi:hypothetical protein